METKLISFDQFAGTYLPLIFLAFLYLSGCGEKPQHPEVLLKKSLENPIVKVSRFWRVDTNEAISDQIMVKPGDGFYAVIELEPLKDLPEMMNELPITNPRYWPCVAVCYPKESNSDSNRAVRFLVDPLYLPDQEGYATRSLAPLGPQMIPPMFKGPLALKLANQPVVPSIVVRDNVTFSTVSSPDDPISSRNPELEHKFDKAVSPYWTFLGPTHGKPGEYTLEIHVFPFCSGRLMDNSPLGPGLSVYKGTLTILK